MDKVMIKDDVKDALAAGQPVIALESTIISHGLPYPANRDCALMLEQTARDNGAVPATIAVLDGQVRIGISADELELLATAQGVHKVSRQDVGYVLATRRPGATTVAGTMLLACQAGIRFFATGGIGGVHRGAEDTFDISADLEELARTPVAVISAGAKAILDIPKTLEYLETKGVPVIGYGVDTFPLFYTRTSKNQLVLSTDSLDELAAMIACHWSAPVSGGGILVANPIPASAEMAYEYINGLIEQTVAEVARRKITGKAVTPYILGRICELSEGKSVTANLELVRNNVVVGSQLAVAYGNR